MQVRTGNKLILSTSNDGCIIIAEVEANKGIGKGEYEVSESMMRMNVKSGTFTDVRKSTGYKGRIYAYTLDL
tara:strand:+ start:480 stop:695 length:216 start_codon:yes stop_codon:yes gene_type:complete